MTKARTARVLALLLAFGFIARVTVALHADNILWPDEIFQYLEQAHRRVFGYGYVPWEYRHDYRSWLFPGFLSFWLWLCKLARLDDPAFYIPLLKIILSALSTSLVYSGYRLARNLSGRGAGLLAALLIAGWYELIYFGHKPLTEAVAAYSLVGLAACVTEPRLERGKMTVAGILAGLTIALRLQYAPAVLFLGAWLWRRREPCGLLGAVIGFAAVVLFAGWIDRLTWGGWFESYYNGIVLNAVVGISKQLDSGWGIKPFSWYFGAIGFSSLGLFWFCLILGSVLAKQRLFVPAACAWLILVSHAFLAHKEYRYSFGAIPFLLVIFAQLMKELVAPSFSKRGRRAVGIAGILLFLPISALGLLYRLPEENRIYPFPLLPTWPILEAYPILFRDPELRALAVLDPDKVLMTGGYYYLHRDIPIYFPDDLKSLHIGRDELRAAVSHVVCHRDEPVIPGFVKSRELGNLEIRRNLLPAEQLPEPTPNRRNLHPFLDEFLARWKAAQPGTGTGILTTE